jgi:hypothetical protein
VFRFLHVVSFVYTMVSHLHMSPCVPQSLGESNWRICWHISRGLKEKAAQADNRLPGTVRGLEEVEMIFDRLRFFCVWYETWKGRDSSVGIALGYWLDDRGSRVRFPAGAGNFSLHRVQNGSGAHPAPYPMGTRGSFPGGKVARAWSWPLTSI